MLFQCAKNYVINSGEQDLLLSKSQDRERASALLTENCGKEVSDHFMAGPGTEHRFQIF